MGEMHLRECLVFLDDVIIFSKTIDEHFDRLDAVFRRLKENGLKLKGSKCEFFKTEVKYLGFVVSEEGIKPDEDKIEDVQNWPEITNVKEFYVILSEVRKRLRKNSKAFE